MNKEKDMNLRPEEDAVFKQHKAEIEAAFDERSLFRRLRDMFVGLAKPHQSAEFKRARTEVQRLAAPVLAILLPSLAFFALVVITAVTSEVKKEVDIFIPSAPEPTPFPDPPPDPKPDPNPDPMPPNNDGPIIDNPFPLPPMPSPTPVPSPSPTPVSPDVVRPNPDPALNNIILSGPKNESFTDRKKRIAILDRDGGGGVGGGDAITEDVVLRALRWLKKIQRANGSISDKNSSVALSNTALAILAFLAHGETPTSPEFGPTVEKALDFVIASHYVDKDGVSHFRNADGNEYAYLIATYALCEAYGMTANPNAKHIAQQTLQRIVDNQSPTGGWDYKINKQSTRDDMSFAGWALQALKAGKMAGLHPKGLDECIKKAMRGLKARNFRGGGFNYTAGGAPTGLTATGCLAMQLLGYMNEKEVKESLETMRAWLPGFDAPAKGAKLNAALPGPNPQYYCYYASQCKFQAGMCAGASKANRKAWQDWNHAMKTLYPKRMIVCPETIRGVDGKPRKMGYWTSQDETCKVGGDAMATCLCALQLMVYYRYLPTTQASAANVATPARGKKPQKKIEDVNIDVDI